MKKELSVVLLLTIFLTMLSACSTPDKDNFKYEPLTAYINVSSSESLGSAVSATHQYITVTADDIPEPQSNHISVSVLGTQFTAEYVDKKAQDFGLPSYTYATADGDKIAVDGSGNILSFETVSGFNYYSSEPTREMTQNAAWYLEKATVLLEDIFGAEVSARFTGALPNITTTKVWVFFSPNSTTDRFTTTESITIVLSSDGDLLSYYTHNLNAFNNVTVPSDLTDERLEQLITASLGDSTAEIELDAQKKLVILSDGSCACNMSFKITSGNNAGAIADVVIPLE